MASMKFQATQLFRFQRFDGDFRAFLSWLYDQRYPTSFMNYCIAAWDNYHAVIAAEKEFDEQMHRTEIISALMESAHHNEILAQLAETLDDDFHVMRAKEYRGLQAVFTEAAELLAKGA